MAHKVIKSPTILIMTLMKGTMMAMSRSASLYYICSIYCHWSSDCLVLSFVHLASRCSWPRNSSTLRHLNAYVSSDHFSSRCRPLSTSIDFPICIILEAYHSPSSTQYLDYAHWVGLEGCLIIQCFSTAINHKNVVC